MGNHYKTLGLNKKASDKEIKKAFRDLSKKHHPDKGGDEDTFKEIASAYDVLSDKKKRARYDNGGIGQHRNPFQQQMVRRGSNIRMTIKLTLQEIDSGLIKKLKYTHKVLCDDCGGSGGTEKVCSVCNGNGVIVRTVRTPMGMMQSQTTCTNCDGSGNIIDVACKTCHGEGGVNAENEIEFEVPPGINDGDTFVYNDGGNYIRNGVNGDVLIRVSEIPHEILTRNGGDLHYTLLLTYPEITIGGKFEVPLLDGKIKIKVPPLTNPNHIVRVLGKGMSIHLGGKGNYFIELRVKGIDKLTDEIKDLLEKLQKNLV